MRSFERELRLRVANISQDDIDRVVYVWTHDDNRTLESIARNHFKISIEEMTRSLLKVFDALKTDKYDGTNGTEIVGQWFRGVIDNPFRVWPKVENGDLPNFAPTDDVIFAYGSLLDPESLAKTIDEDPANIQYCPAVLLNHELEWGAPSRRLNTVDNHWRSLDCVEWLWLVVRAVDGREDGVPGALVAVKGRQFRKVQDRESHYRTKTVTDHIRVNGTPLMDLRRSKLKDVEVVTFAPKSEGTSSASRLAVKKSYVSNVTECLRRVHSDESIKLPAPPAGVRELEAYQADDRVVDEYRSTIPLSELDNSWAEMDKNLYVERRATRQSALGHETIPFVLRPLILNHKTHKAVVEAAECAVSLMVKAHRLVLQSDDLFELNGYNRADRLLNDPSLANHAKDEPVVARVDMTLQGDKLSVFEVNADSPAGMFHLDQLVDLQWRNIESWKPNTQLIDLLEPPPKVLTCESVVNGFMQHWRSYSRRSSELGVAKQLNHIAIVDVDVENAAAYSEFEHFKRLLSKHNATVSILDSRDLGFQRSSKTLHGTDGKPIDAVYKRLLWKEAREYGLGGLTDPLSDAYLNDAVFVMNSFRSRRVGSKLNLAIVKSKSFGSQCNKLGIDLTPKEVNVLGNSIPDTVLWQKGATLDDRPAGDLLDYVMEDVTGWVLKGFHGQGGQEFVDGAPERGRLPNEDFVNLWEKGGYIAQQRQTHGDMEIPIFDGIEQGHEWKRQSFILGAYVIDGKCVAIEAKVSEKIPINIGQTAQRTAVFSLKN